MEAIVVLLLTCLKFCLSKPFLSNLMLIIVVSHLRYHSMDMLLLTYFSCSLQSAILVDSNVKAIDCYQEMVSLFEKLRGSTCKNLLEYLKNTIRFWSTTLKDRLNKYVKRSLASISFTSFLVMKLPSLVVVSFVRGDKSKFV